MAELELPVMAQNREQAEYLIRSRARQRGVDLQGGVDVVGGGLGFWYVTVTVADADADKLAASALDRDTQVWHAVTHPPMRGNDGD